MDEANERFPDHRRGRLLDRLLAGARRPDDEALETLRRAEAIEPRVREWAAKDEDLASVRDRLSKQP